MSRPAIAHIHLDHLSHNYRLLAAHAGEAAVMAVVKADAYGHGLSLVAPALYQEGCRHFGVSDAVEGASLRRLLPDGADAPAIYPLSGIFDGEDAGLAATHALTPFIAERGQAERLAAAGFTGTVWIKIDTGMGRLGAESPLALAESCRGHGMTVAGLASHLACADTPGHALNALQAALFTRALAAFPAGIGASLLNSAGLLSLPDMTGDLVRPGIALYGSEPVPGRPMGVKPVMRLTGEVMQRRSLPAHTPISYGASFVTPEAMPVAVVCLGYGDGLPRGLSNRGAAMLGDIHLPIIGRICMDYVMLDARAAPDIAIGDTVEFWGPSQSADAVAESLGTIAYTLFTGVAPRVARQPLP